MTSAADVVLKRYQELDWQPIETAPKDGRVILLTWMEGGKAQEIWPMQWMAIQRNEFFAPGKVGMWTMPGGGATWNDDNPDGAPTHWHDEILPSGHQAATTSTSPTSNGD